MRGGIAISGIFDLEPIRLNYLNEKLGLDTAEVERNSPVRHLPAMAGELVVAYGTRELPELCRQSIEYGREWTERGLPGRQLPVEMAGVFTPHLGAACPPIGDNRVALGDSRGVVVGGIERSIPVPHGVGSGHNSVGVAVVTVCHAIGDSR